MRKKCLDETLFVKHSSVKFKKIWTIFIHFLGNRKNQDVFFERNATKTKKIVIFNSQKLTLQKL